MTRVGAAVVGTGFIGVVHVEALRRLGIDVVGVVGSSPERAREKPGLPEPYESFEAMLADDRVDVVHLTTPNSLHYPQAKAALAAGKHVVCEKPLAIDPQESAELLRLAEESGLVHCTNYNIRYYALCREACARVRRGDLGAIHAVYGSYIQHWLLDANDWNWRLEPEQGGSLRVVADIGTHWLDLTSFVAGKRVASVCADLHTVHTTRHAPVAPVETFAGDLGDIERVDRAIESEDLAHVLLRYEDGARGSMTVSQVAAGRKNRLTFEVDGAAGSLAWNSEQPDELWLGQRDRPDEVLQRDPALLDPYAASATDLPGGHIEGFADTFKQLYRAVYAAVVEGRMPTEPDFPTFADGHDAMLVAAAIARSSAEERWVEVER